MRNAFLLLSALLLFALSACKDKNKAAYENCCGTEPNADSFLIHTQLWDDHGNLVDTNVQVHVYIPNIFIIDNSGENNFLNVFGNDLIAKVSSIVFTAEDGTLLFSKENVQPNDPAGGWDGLKPDGSFYKGSFNYQVTVEAISGDTKTYTGKACAFHCHDEGFPSENIPNCFFPSQHDGNGGVDPGLPGSGHCF